MNVQIKKIVENAISPQYAHPGDAGADLFSVEDSAIPAGGSKVVKTGLTMKVPEGLVGMVCSRSGLAAKNNIFVLNAPGIIDSGYLGEWMVILFNASEKEFLIHEGDKIAQAVFVPFVSIETFEEVEIFEETSRGQGGLGSTGGVKHLG